MVTINSVAWSKQVIGALPMALRGPLNPSHVAAGKQALEWAVSHNLLQDDRAVARMVSVGPDKLIGYGFNRASEDVVQILVKWTILFFVIDDMFDEGAAGRDEQAAHRVLAPLKQQLSDRTHLADGGVAAALRELLDDTGRRQSDMQQTFFWKHIDDWFDALVQEAANRRSGSVPDLDSYLTLRQNSGPILPLFDLMEESECIRLPTKFYEMSEYQTLLVGASDISHWLNDVFSVPKELKQNDFHNLVLVIQHNRGGTLSEALIEATHHMRRRLGEMREAMERVHEMHADNVFNQCEIEAVTRWYEALLRTTRHAVWYLDSGRYGARFPV